MTEPSCTRPPTPSPISREPRELRRSLHDLANMLLVVQGGIELTLGGTMEDDAARDLLEHSRVAAAQAIDLCRELREKQD